MLKNKKAKTISKIILSVALAFFILPFLFSSCNENDVGESNGSATPANKSEPKEKDFELSKTVFLGDSNIAHLAAYGLVDDERILTGSEYYLTLEPDVFRKYVVCKKANKEMTPAEAVKFLSPDFLVITLGTDGALSLDREGFELSYDELIESIKNVSPNTEIILQSIFPVRQGERNIRFYDVKYANQKFTEANKWISELAEKYDLCYINTASVLCDESGELKREYNTAHLDGYHLNREGLCAMLDYICENAGGSKK